MSYNPICSYRQDYKDYGIYGRLIIPPIRKTFIRSHPHFEQDLAPYVRPEHRPQAINFNRNPQELNGLRFVLAENSNHNLDLMLSTVPTLHDKRLLFGRDTSEVRTTEIFGYYLRTTSDFIRTGQNFGDLTYLIFAGDLYIGFGSLQFLSSQLNNFVEAEFTPRAREEYRNLISRPHVIANISIAIHPALRGLGYGQLIGTGLVDILYTQTNADVAYYVTTQENIPSLALGRRLGFREVETTNPMERTFIMVFER